MLINNKEILLIGVPFLKETTYINKNILDKTIIGAIKTAQDIKLKEVIGEKLLKSLCQMVYDEDLKGDYKIFVEQYVRNYLQYETMSELQIPIFAKLRTEGVITTQGTEYQQLSRNDIDYTRKYYDNLGDQVAIEMVKWLDEKKFPEWTTTACKDANKFTTNICL